MSKKELNLQEVYLNQMIEVRSRLNAALLFIESYFKTSNTLEFDCAILQLRKALEATAYASICTNKKKYKDFRQKGERPSNFTKDFNATKIFENLEKINKDFYPVPLLPANKRPDGTWHFERKEKDFLTKMAFSSIYDRLGKFLHADNPWDNNKQRQNMAKDVKNIIPELFSLLELHATFIRAENYSKVWIVEVPRIEPFIPKVIEAIANGDFLSVG